MACVTLTALFVLPRLPDLTMQLSDFDYNLPPHLIAQHPLAERQASRLLVCKSEDQFLDSQFVALSSHLQPGDVLVFNDTKVIPARLHGHKSTGGQVEILVERVLSHDTAWVHLKASKTPKVGAELIFEPNIRAEMCGRCGPENSLFELRFHLGADAESYADLYALLEAHGQLPLPPYIEHSPDQTDQTRYQTVYAQHPGAVAAPTAGLHFTPELLVELQAKGIDCAYLTLHVGAGTFQPVRVENVAEHRMHSERYQVPPESAALINAAKAAGRRIVAVGTTSLRTLEAASQSGQLIAGASETDIFITPGYRFKMVDALVTNFHLPKSTLMMLVSAFAGHDLIRAAYAHAIAQEYRFFSYGDAMLLTRSAN